MDEAALIASARSGDVDAFNRLVLLYQGVAYNVAFRILGDRDMASDATQDAFLAAHKAIGTLRGNSFKPWLLRIVTNTCYDQMRRLRRRPSERFGDLEMEEDILSQLADPSERPDDLVERRELNRLLQEGLGHLPATMRVVLVLADVEGLKYEEIAQVTGLEMGTVKSRLSRGRMHLRDYLLKRRELLPPRYQLARSETERPAERAARPASRLQPGPGRGRGEYPVVDQQIRNSEGGAPWHT